MGREEGEGKRLEAVEDTCLGGSWIVHENDSRFKDEHAIPLLRRDKFYGMLFEISRSCNDRVVRGVEKINRRVLVSSRDGSFGNLRKSKNTKFSEMKNNLSGE